MRTVKQLAQQAMNIQSASNLRGLANSLPEVMDQIRALGGDERVSPIVYLWAVKILSMLPAGECLCERSSSVYGSAYRACERMVATGLFPNPDAVKEGV